MESIDKRVDLVSSLAAKKDLKAARAELGELEKGNDTSSAYQGELYYLQALILYNEDHYNQALEKAECAYQTLRQTSRNKRIGQVQLLLAYIYVDLGDLKRAEIEAQDAVSSFRRAGDDHGLTKAYNKLAQIFFVQAEFERSIECLNQVTDYAKNFQEGHKLIPRISGNLGRIYLLLGEWEKAQRCLYESLRQNEQTENRTSSCANLLSLGYSAAKQRKFKEAERFYQKAFQIIQEKNLKRELAIYHEYVAECALEQKDYDRGYAEITRAIEIGEQIAPQSTLLSQSYRILAQLQVATGKLNLAEVTCQKFWKVSSRLSERVEEGLVHRVMGQIFARKNNRKPAEESFRASMAGLEKIGCKFELARTYLAAGAEVVFDALMRKEYLSNAESIINELFPNDSPGNAYFLGIAKIEQAQAQFETQNYDSSIDVLNQAEVLLKKASDGLPADDRNFEHIARLRLQVETAIADKSVSLDNRYNIFRLFLSEIESPETSEDALQDHSTGIPQEDEISQNLTSLAKKLKADRGFILLKNEEIDASPPLIVFNLSPEEAEKIKSTAQRMDGELTTLNKPIYSASGESDWFLGDMPEVSSLLIVPLRMGEEIKGVLYLDRKENGSPSHPFRRDELNLSVAFADIIGLKLAEIENKKLEEENLRLKQQLKDKSAFSNIITQNGQMLEVMWKLSQVKDTNLSILIEGETGTGKDQLAKAIHYNSNRKDKNFVVVNCAAFPETLLENELFGHKKGAYTGASQDKRGLIEEANGGTLYLDETAEINPATQVKLLRVLEEKELTRLGETKPRKVDIRVISATSLNIRDQIEKGLFRKDLFFRLNTIHVSLPPLRGRKEDIPLLVDYFIRIHAPKSKDGIPKPSPAIVELLTNYDWPGNIRELENEIKRLVAIKDGESVVASDILSEKMGIKNDAGFAEMSLYERVATWEKQFILKALIESNWVKKTAATALHIPESSLRFKIKQHKIKIPTD
jgi:Nif-specific regulatory protein